MSESDWRDALRSVAHRWTDPDYTPRADAVERTLAAENRFTPESLAFALNHGADLIARGGIERWMGEEVSTGPLVIGVCSRGRAPLEGMFEAAAASLVTDQVLLSLSPHSPSLAERFFLDVADEAGERRVVVVPESELANSAAAVIATGMPEDLDEWEEQLQSADIPPERQLIRRARTGIAVIDGTESRAALSGLAEDALLHEGTAPQNVRAIFAPAAQSPDSVLEAMAGFREIFPPHELTSGSLAMKVAYLEALGMSLAIGPGFLVTRGEIEIQEGAHIRWVEYDSLEGVMDLLADYPPEHLAITTSETIAASLREKGMPADIPVLDFGDSHRPELGQAPLTDDVPRFLARLI